MKTLKSMLVLAVFFMFCSMIQAQEIFDAIKANDIDKVRSIIRQSPDLVQARDASGSSPLHAALSNKSSEIAMFLIDSGCDVNSKTNRGDTPLHLAANNADMESIRLLLSKGAVVTAANTANFTPLDNAIFMNNIDQKSSERLEIVRILLEQGADVNNRGMWNWLQIQVAAEFGSEAMVDLLIEKGVELPVQSERESSQLVGAACRQGFPNLLSKMLEKGYDLKPDENNGNLLHLAVEGGSEKIVEQLLSLGFEVMANDGYGWSPLHYAAEKGRLKAAETLLENGAVIDDRSPSGWTAYNLAAMNGHGDVCQTLAAKGADRSERKFPVLSGPYLGQQEPAEPSIFALDIVSTKYFLHGNVIFSPDGNEAFWSPWIPEVGLSGEEPRIVTSRYEGGRWSEPETASFSKIGFKDDSPFVSPDGRRIFFVSRRPLKAGEDMSRKENLWVVERKGKGWSEPVPVEAVNHLNLHWQMSVDRKGNLYFGASDPEGKKLSEIFCSTCQDGVYGKPEKLSDKINSENHEGSPQISPDGDYILFDRADQRGRQMGIFISFLGKDGIWTEAQSITEYAKIPGRSQCCHVTYDKKYLFYITWYREAASFWTKADFIEEMRKSL